MRTCTKCGVTKSLDAFYAAKNRPGGHRTDCKTCVLDVRRANYAADPQKYIARVRARR